MEKLIELLNEFLEEKGRTMRFEEINLRENRIFLKSGMSIDISYILTKRFQWIQWLVDNDKIDRSKFKKYSTGNTQGEREIQKIYYYGRISTNELNYTEGYSEVDELLMILSIQDNSIEFLISLLK